MRGRVVQPRLLRKARLRCVRVWIGGGRMHAAMHHAWAHTSRTRAASRWQVWQSLPSSLQQAFASQKIALVELALKLLLDEVGEQELERLMQRCLEARFWDKPEDYTA